MQSRLTYAYLNKINIFEVLMYTRYYVNYTKNANRNIIPIGDDFSSYSPCIAVIIVIQLVVLSLELRKYLL